MISRKVILIILILLLFHYFSIAPSAVRRPPSASALYSPLSLMLIAGVHLLWKIPRISHVDNPIENGDILPSSPSPSLIFLLINVGNVAGIFSFSFFPTKREKAIFNIVSERMGTTFLVSKHFCVGLSAVSRAMNELRTGGRGGGFVSNNDYEMVEKLSHSIELFNIQFLITISIHCYGERWGE